MKKIKDVLPNFKTVMSKARFTQVNVLLGIILFFIIIIMLMIINLQSNQKTVTKSAKEAQIILDSNQQFQGELVTYAKNTNEILKKIAEKVKENQGELSDVAKSFKKDQQQVATLIKESRQRLDKVTTKLNSGLEEKGKKLDKVIKKLLDGANAVTNTIALYKEITHDKPYKTAKDYTIFAVENYGVVLQDKHGNYILAQINKPLEGIGKIKAITEDFILAGDYRIVKQEDFKTVSDEQTQYYN